MNTQEMIEACLKHTMYSWSATGKVSPMPIERAEGIWLYGPDGQKWLDFNSQLMSVNIGHSHPRVVQAIKDQADSLIYTFPGSATKVRAQLGKKLADLVPGNINTFFFNENRGNNKENKKNEDHINHRGDVDIGAFFSFVDSASIATAHSEIPELSKCDVL